MDPGLALRKFIFHFAASLSLFFTLKFSQKPKQNSAPQRTLKKGAVNTEK